jgi:very-short-patch-repair endonuclease
MLRYKSHLKLASRRLRNDTTDAERLLWKRLRGKQICGLSFHRQKPLAGYIADFYCAKAKLVIELDGSQHFEMQNQLYDAERTRVLEALGMRVLRFDNRQVVTELESVLEKILEVVLERGEVQCRNPP